MGYNDSMMTGNSYFPLPRRERKQKPDFAQQSLGFCRRGGVSTAIPPHQENLSPLRELRFSILSLEGRGIKASAGGKDDEDSTVTPHTNITIKPKPLTQKPSMYKVLLLNDDYTPMEFVVLVLESFFGKSREEATRIMLHVHRKGVGLCGVYTYEVAETKVAQVMAAAREAQHPLQCTMEKE